METQPGLNAQSSAASDQSYRSLPAATHTQRKTRRVAEHWEHGEHREYILLQVVMSSQVR